MASTKKHAEAAVATAEVTLQAARGTLHEWQSTLDKARGGVADLEAESGEALLDAPERAASWPVRVREARDAVTVAERAVAAQELRVVAAEQGWCRAQADLLAVSEVAPAREALQQHEARTAELLAALEEHDGVYVPQAALASARRAAGYVEGTPVQRPKSLLLVVAVARATVRHQVLVAMAEGADPEAVVAARAQASSVSEDECYPEAVRATGLVPAPVFERRIAKLQAAVNELEELPEVLRSEIADLEEQATRGELPADVLKSATARRLARIEEVPEELNVGRSELAMVSGAGLGGAQG